MKMTQGSNTFQAPKSQQRQEYLQHRLAINRRLSMCAFPPRPCSSERSSSPRSVHQPHLSPVRWSCVGNAPVFPPLPQPTLSPHLCFFSKNLQIFGTLILFSHKLEDEHKLTDQILGWSIRLHTRPINLTVLWEELEVSYHPQELLDRILYLGHQQWLLHILSFLKWKAK